MRHITVPALLAALVVSVAAPSAPLLAQGAPRSAAPPAPAPTPEALAERYIAALRANDWAAVARLMHPRALATMRDFVDAVAAKDPSGEFRGQVLGIHSDAERTALSDEDIFARFLGATMGMQEGMAEVLGSMGGTVLGHVNEGADTAHVLYRLRMSMEGVEMTKVDVLSAARDGAGWRALLTADIENMIRQIRGA